MVAWRLLNNTSFFFISPIPAALSLPPPVFVQLEGSVGFAQGRQMQAALKGQRWGRRLRFHCNEAVGSVPVDMANAEDAAVVLAAKHYFKYASGVYGACKG